MSRLSKWKPQIFIFMLANATLFRHVIERNKKIHSRALPLKIPSTESNWWKQSSTPHNCKTVRLQLTHPRYLPRYKALCGALRSWDNHEVCNKSTIKEALGTKHKYLGINFVLHRIWNLSIKFIVIRFFCFGLQSNFHWIACYLKTLMTSYPTPMSDKSVLDQNI